MLRSSHPLSQPGRYPKMARENRRLPAVQCLGQVGNGNSNMKGIQVWIFLDGVACGRSRPGQNRPDPADVAGFRRDEGMRDK